MSTPCNSQPRRIVLDLLIGFLLLGVFLATNGYTYGWDDQHLEIPLLKSIIDPSLYAGDYYVEALKKNFISFLYPLLARVITIEQIPAAFFGLYLVSRYFLFFWTYKLWQAISGRRDAALACTLMIIVLGRVEEFLYRTFSHQEFALAIIAAGLYYFYRGRSILTGILLGAAANFHALYALFPMIYVTIHQLRERPVRWRTWWLSGAGFIAAALPIFIWIVSRKILGGAGPPPPAEGPDGWLQLYRIACPQNFIFYDNTLRELVSSASVFFTASRDYWIIAALWTLNAFANPVFKNDRRTQTVLWTGTAFLVLSLVFSHIWPVRFVLDLNLVRHVQWMLFFLYGHTMLLAIRTAGTAPVWTVAGLGLLLPLLRLGGYVVVWTGLAMSSVLLMSRVWTEGGGQRRFGRKALAGAVMLAAIAGLGWILSRQHINQSTLRSLGVIMAAATIIIPIWYIRPAGAWRRRLCYLIVIAPLVVFLLQFSYYHRKRLTIERTGPGFWQMQRAWIDMQNYAREHTPVDAVFLVPHDMEMGGFRIFSQREIVVSYRDCGVVGFDLAAGQEWQQRLDDVGSFKVFVDGPVTRAIVAALGKYQVDYIVFMNYLAPVDNPLLEPVYHNDVFALYKVRR